MTDSEDSDLGGKHDGQGPILIGLRLKQVVLAFGAVYLGMVALTNLVNFVSQVSGASPVGVPQLPERRLHRDDRQGVRLARLV